MNLQKTTEQIEEFKCRIEKTLCMQVDEEELVQTQKFLSNWVKLQTDKIKLELEEYKKKNTGIMGGMRMLGLIKSEKNIEEIQKLDNDLQDLRKCLKDRFIPKNFEFKYKSIPEEVQQAVEKLKDRKWCSYYAYVKGPFIKNRYIAKKQDFHNQIENVVTNDLKLIMIQQKVAHKYQRNLVQEIFGRVLRSGGSLTMVLKIIVGDDPLDEPYFLYCYIQDIKFKKQIEWSPLTDLKTEENDIYISKGGRKLQVQKKNLFEIILGEILILPVQTLVSNYILQISQDQIQILKCNELDQQLIIQHTGLQSHPSLRNPLIFLVANSIQQHTQIHKIQSITNSEELYENFYKALTIMMELTVTDFSCTTINEQLVYSSLCFSFKTFEALWISFHKIVGLKGWLKQVISPIKSTISTTQILNHFCPIFVELSQYNKESIEANTTFLQGIDIESYLTTFIKKKTLEKYKNMYVSIEDDGNLLSFASNYQQAYDEIFKPVLEEVDLQYISKIEAIYIIDFVCRYKYSYKPNIETMPDTWNNKKIWKKCIQYAKENKLKFVDIGFDIFSYHYGHDTFERDPDAFERIRNTPETDNILGGIDQFVKLIREKYDERILSSLLEKAFKHKKYEICQRLLENYVQIRDFKDTFTFEELINPKYKELRQTIMAKIKNQSPQMHRIFKWQQLLYVQLQKKQGKKVQTFDYGQCFIPDEILARHIKNGRVINNLSRKDYRFDSSREIAEIDTCHCRIFYLERCLHPLLNYFYKIFYSTLGIPEIMPYFTTFFHDNILYTISEHLPEAINYKKGLGNFSEQELNIMADEKLISQAILSTMVLLPKQIHLKDILIQPCKSQRDQIFIIDLQSFYSKHYFSKMGNSIGLNCKNALFTFDTMQKSVHPEIIKKFGELDVIKFVGQCFEGYSQIIESINEMRRRNCDSDIPNQQFLGLIFENGFIINLTQRLFKIKSLFKKKNFDKGISYLKVLKALDPQAHDYYREIIQSETTVTQREKLLFDENWKKSFVNSLNLIEFFGNFRKLQDQQYRFPDHYYKLCFNGPSESLNNLTNSMKKFTAFSNTLPQDLNLFSNQYFQYFIKNVDISEIDPETKQKLLDAIREKACSYLQNPSRKLLPLTYIRIQQAQNMKQRFLYEFSYQRVQEFVIEDSKVGDYEMNNMPKSIQNILYLTLKGIKGLKSIGENTLFGNAVQIKHLKVLTISECSDLINIDVKCDILESIELKDNPVLENLFVYSNFLKNIYCSHNPSMNLQNIGAYILKGINVIMCKTACRGDLMKLYQDTYDKYILNLFKFMISKFFNQEARYLIVLTLTKMKVIDENILTSLAAFKGLSFVPKFSLQVEDKILKSIIKLFYSNPYIKTIPTYFLTESFALNPSINTDKLLKLMTQTLKKNPNSSWFKEIYIQKPTKTLSPKTLSSFIEFLSAIKFHTNVKICFQNYSFDDSETKSENLSFSKTFEAPHLSSNQSQNISMDKKNQLEKQSNLDNGLNNLIEIISFLSTRKSNIQKLRVHIIRSTINKTFFDHILSRMLKNLDEQKLEKSQSQNSEKTGSQKLIEEIANKYKGGFKKIIDNTKMMKKKQSISSEISQPDNQSDKSVVSSSIRKIKIENSVVEGSLSLSFKLSQFNAYESIRELKVINSEIYSALFFQKMSNLTHLYLVDSIIQEDICENKYSLFSILKKKQIKTLELSGYFKKTDEKSKFAHFCAFIQQTQSLNNLVLRNNQLSIQSLTQFNKIINKTSITQLTLCSIDLFNEQSQKCPPQTQIVKQYTKFLTHTEKVRSLTIEFHWQTHMEAFIISISTNQSILQLTLLTNSEISSKILEPLRKNETLSVITSNNQLPTWLLTHVKSNTNTNYRKSNIYSFVNESQEIDISNQDENQNLYDMLNNSSTGRSEDFYRIGLSLDGGGMRGMLLATQMSYLEKQVGKPLCKIFDCIGGTSIGGILSLAATGTNDGFHPICNSEQFMQIFTKYGKQIFKKSQIRQFKNLFDTRYSPSSIEGVLKNYFKESKLSDVIPDTSVVVTAVNRMDNKDYIFRSKEAILHSERDFYMRDVARATSAAPIYFPSAQIKNINATMKLSLLDGGMGMNNPSKLVIDEIKKQSANSGNYENFFLLSLGTGRLPCENIPENAGLKDLSPIIDSFTQSANYFTQRDLGDHYKGHFIRVSPMINIENKKDGQLDNISPQIINVYRETGLQSARRYFKNTVIFGKYRNLNLIEWLKENTARKYDF